MTSKNNTNINILAVSFLIITLAISYYFVFALPKQNKTDFAPTPVDTSKYYKQAELDSCLLKAEQKYSAMLELNSYPAPQEGFPDARRWNDAEIKRDIENQYNKDREFCLELNK